MKKLAAITLALMTALCGFPAAAAFGESASPNNIYESDFSQDTDGWYPRSGDGAAQLAQNAGFITITGRSDTWNSPGRDFELIAGESYKIEFEIRQDELESAEFILSSAYTVASSESYTNIMSGSVGSGVWKKMSGIYIAPAADKYTLYIETKGNASLSYSIRSFSVIKNSPTYSYDIPSLRELYASAFDFGTAVTQNEAVNKKRMDFYASQFSIMTPGNELKPDSVLDVSASKRLVTSTGDEKSVAVHFTAAAPLLDYCKENGIKVHGHVLVWHSQTPDAFFRAGYDNKADFVDRDTMLARLESYIKQIMEYMDANYPGLIVSWDVVNEAIDDNGGALRQSNWTKVVGDDFIERAFEYARKYAPEGTLLVYNDYNTPIEPKLTGICALLDRLVAEGNIDCYGFQAHLGESTPTPSKMRAAMEKIAAKGLKLRISELDITISKDNEVFFKTQAYRYKSMMELFLEYKDIIEAVQVWGVCDDLSWRASQFPLLFDKYCQPKPAFNALVELAQSLAE
ncbi:MAG: endo-1,4-beta-xylanase [Eubacteriales bacterium]|nr:endo-1,4-beta-xylanase [Eubacteriales bacterium]